VFVPLLRKGVIDAMFKSASYDYVHEKVWYFMKAKNRRWTTKSVMTPIESSYTLTSLFLTNTHK